jgi:CTP synthase
VSERHRHRYEVNPAYHRALTEHGMRFSGMSPDGRLVEIIELPGHPFFMAGQFHPELKSRPGPSHPMFREFVGAALARKRGGRQAQLGDTTSAEDAAGSPFAVTG